MAEGWYLSDIIGTGTLTDPYRAAVHDLLAGQLGASYATSVMTNFLGVPIKGVTMVHVDADDHTALMSDLRVVPLPTVLGRRWSAFPLAIRTRIAAAFTIHGITLETGDDPTVLQVVDRLGVQIAPGFSSQTTRARGGPS